VTTTTQHTRKAQMDDVLTTVVGNPITVRDVMTLLKIKGVFRSTIYEAIEEHIVQLKANELGIELSDEQVDAARDELRAMRGLGDPVRFQAWLRNNGVTLETWNEHVHIAALRKQLKRRMISAEMIQKHFDQHRQRHATVTLGRIVSATEGDARTALRELERGRSFAGVAVEHSIDPATGISGGHIGVVQRGLLAPPIEAAVFAAASGAVIGPLPEGGNWSIYKIHARAEPQLTDAVATAIADKLFCEWIRQAVMTVPA